MTKESVWLPPQCIVDRLEQEQVLNLQQIVVDELQSSIDTIMKTLQKEQVLLVQAEECSKLMKIAARDATNSKATLLLGLNDRSEHMKNVLSKIRTRAMEGPQCLECSRKRATRRCTTCKSPYCASCFNTKHATGDFTGEYFKRRERASRNGSTVVDISIPPPSYKPVSLSFSRSHLF
jgi:hypothetical protein